MSTLRRVAKVYHIWWFEAGTDFASWGTRIAYYEILGYRKRRKRGKLVFSNDMIEDMIPIIEIENKKTDGKIEALKQCLKKMGKRARELVKLRYYDGLKATDISNRTGLTVSNVYKTLARINGNLLVCVERVVRQN